MPFDADEPRATTPDPGRWARTPALAVAPPPPPDPVEAAEAAAWASVLAAWEDEAAHRAYLARPLDLEGLALAGRRYRGVLAERPGDPLAARFRDEVVQRAMVQGLAALPRSAPPRRLPRWIAVVVIGGGSALLFGWAATALFRLVAGPAGALP